MFDGGVIFKLNTISLVPQEIDISPEDFTFDQRLPLYKLEVWLENILLDETYEIKVSEKKVNHANKVFLLTNKTFRYFARELFNKLKVARLKIILLRGSPHWEQSEQIQTFNIILSQYSYEYCKNKYNQFREHSVGIIKRGFFHYRVLCQYEQQIISQQSQPKEQNQKVINISEKTKNTESDQPQVKILPINSLPQDNEFEESPIDAYFMELNELKPIFRHESYEYDKMRIKVQGSFINADDFDSQESSVLKQNNRLKDIAGTICSSLYYAYLIIGLIFIVVQMSPESKIR